MSDLSSIPQLLKDKNFEQAIAILESISHLEQNLDHLRLLIGLCLDTNHFTKVQTYLAQLYSVAGDEPSYYFFKGLLAQKNHQMPEAIEAFKTAFYINPAQQQPLKQLLPLIKKLGLEKNYRIDADIVLCTGGHFYEKKFHAHTIHQRGIGGSESAFIYVAHQLKKLGYKVAAFCNCDQPGEYDGVPYYNINEFPTFHFINKFSRVIGLRLPDAFLGNLNPKAQHVFWLQDDPYTMMYKDFKAQNYRIDRFFVLSEYHCRRWMEKTGYPREKFFITKNGYDPQLFFPKPKKQQQIIFASRPERGLKESVLAFTKLKSEFPDLKLVLCTYTQEKSLQEDPEIQAVRHLFDQSGIEFQGSLAKEDFAKVMQESMLLFHPNMARTVETSCIAAIEAQACGVPVICGRGGAMEETVQHQIGGLVIDDQGDPNILVEKFYQETKKLLQDPNAYQKLSQGAHEWAFDNYRWDSIVPQWIKELGMTAS